MRGVTLSEERVMTPFKAQFMSMVTVFEVYDS